MTDIKAPFKLHPDPDGPTTITNRDGFEIGQVSPNVAELFQEAPAMLAILRFFASQDARWLALVGFQEWCKVDDRYVALLEKFKDIEA